jgi:hypothetical protein
MAVYDRRTIVAAGAKRNSLTRGHSYSRREAARFITCPRTVEWRGPLACKGVDQNTEQ